MEERKMTKIKKQTAIALCLIMVSVLSFSACSKKEEAPPEVKGESAAIVGNSVVSMDTLNGVSALLLYMNSGLEMSDYTEDEQIVWKNQVLTYLCIDNELIKNHFAQENVEVLDKEAKDQISASIDELYASRETLEEAFTASGIKKEHIEYYYEAQLIYEELVDELSRTSPPTEEEIQTYYNENQAALASPATVTASHILISDPEHTDEKRAEITEILAKANGGEDFAKLAREYSDDTASAEEGGLVGTFSQDGEMVYEFESAAFALEPGQISDIVETEFGFHIIKVTEKTPAQIPTLDGAREDIVHLLLSIKISSLVKQWKAETKIQYFVELDEASGEPRIYPMVEDEEVHSEDDGHDHSADSATDTPVVEDPAESTTPEAGPDEETN